MGKTENNTPNNFQKIYDSLTLTEKMSIDSVVKLYFVLFQSIQETFAQQIQQNQYKEKE
ncbi:MAG: hypothetical protein K2I82_03115 [Ruminococcus sp.]|nr:hypothetical protein [Ruminococcus sp.]